MWHVQVDLFFYRDPEEAKEQEEEAPPAIEYGTVDYGGALGAANAQWNDNWGADAGPVPPVPVEPTDNWNAGQG